MIDPITDLIIKENEKQLQEKELDHILEGYDLKCQQCGRVITIIKDGSSPLECCNQRMIVMGSNPEAPDKIEEVRKTLKGQVVEPDFQVPVKNVNFSPFNQADAEEEQRAEWKKKGKRESDEPVEELTKTRSLMGRIATSMTDPTYAQRKKDLVRLRKKTPGYWRKKESQKFDKLTKKVPGLAVKAAKTAKLKGDKTRTAQIRRDSARKLGGYYKMGQVHQQAQEKRLNKKVSDKPSKPIPPVSSKPVKPIQKSKKKDFDPGKFMSMESDLLRSVQIFDELKETITEVDFRKFLDILKKEGFSKEEVTKLLYETPKQELIEFIKNKSLLKQKKAVMGESEFINDIEEDLQIAEAGFETKPKGWTDSSVKKFGKSLVKGGGEKKGFFDKCVEKMKDKMDNPEGFCASVKDEAHDSTYWRGKDKSPQEVGKDVKKHKNV